MGVQLKTATLVVMPETETPVGGTQLMVQACVAMVMGAEKMLVDVLLQIVCKATS